VFDAVAGTPALSSAAARSTLNVVNPFSLSMRSAGR
jgi:hypothetical protein